MMNKPVNRDIQEIYLSLGKKVLVNAEPIMSTKVERRYVVAFTLNMQSLGFMPSQALVDKLSTLDYETFVNETDEIMAALIKLNGSRKNMLPMYPDFPEIMMTLSDEQLFWDAIVHYFTMGVWEARFEQKLKVTTESLLALKVIELGSEDDLIKYTSKLANSSISMSNSQKEYLESLICRYYDELNVDMFDMKNKENMAYVVHSLYRLSHQNLAKQIAINHVKTSTDVLRLIMIFSNGDHTLASREHDLSSLKRAERRLLLELLELVCKNNNQVLEDASKYQGLWVVAGELLHPGDYANRYINAYNFFTAVRNDKLKSWYSKVEKAYDKKDIREVIKLLKQRPGEFARRLERTMRLASENSKDVIYVIDEFATVATKVDSTILLQMQQYFADKYTKPSNIRTFMPKGSMAKVFVKEEDREPLGAFFNGYASRACMLALVEKFSEKEDLGKVYIQDGLKGYALPLKQRTASKQLYSMARGSRIKLPEEAKVLRMYQWWKAPGHVDLDLTAMFIDSDFNKVTSEVSYWSLRNHLLGCVHSGDIRSAQEGAAEFIDVPIKKLKENNVRYVVMTISSYSHQPFCDLEECFAGIMAMDKVKPNEKTFDPAKSLVRSDLSVDSMMATPLVYDVENHEMIWLDAPVTGTIGNGPVNTVTFGNNYTNIVRGLLNASYPQFSTLIEIHCIARNAEIVDTPEEADVIFSLDQGITPFSVEEINSNWL